MLIVANYILSALLQRFNNYPCSVTPKVSVIKVHYHLDLRLGWFLEDVTQTELMHIEVVIVIITI